MKEEVSGVILSTVSFLTALLMILLTPNNAMMSDSKRIASAVQATLWAMPTPVRIEAPLVVEVTRIVPVTPAPLLQATPLLPVTTEVATPTALPLQDEKSAGGDNGAAAVASASKSTDATIGAAAAPASWGGSCPTTSSRQYALIPMENVDANHPPELHGDLNLSLRGHQPVDAEKNYTIYNGNVDLGAPLLHGIFADGRHPTISGVYQVRDWNWACREHGCPSDWLTNYPVNLMGAAVTPGEEIRIPRREAEIYGGGYIAAVLYAEESRLTIAYTRDGTMANGYGVHLEELCVDPNLLALYHTGNGAGRKELPGLHLGDVVGVAGSGELKIAIRDRGTFMDPRSELDWWHN